MIDERLEWLHSEIERLEKEEEYLWTENLCNEDWSQEKQEVEKRLQWLYEELEAWNTGV